MRESALRWTITAIPTCIIIISLILPFGAQNWDIMGTVLPENPFEGLGAGPVPGTGSPGAVVAEPMISVQRSGLSGDGSRVFLEISVKNPMPMAIDVKEISGSLPVGSTMVNLALVEPVSVPPGDSAACRLEGPVPPGFSVQGLSSKPVALSGMRMTISVGGIDMTMDEAGILGGAR